jgi:hypothetical protein
MTWLSYSTRALTLLGILPLVLQKFSSENIVLWYLFSTIIMLGTLADFGFRQTFTRIISFAYSGAETIDTIPLTDKKEGTKEKKCNNALLTSIVSTMHYIYKRLSLISLVLMSTFGTLAMIRPIAKTDNSFEGWIAWAVIILVTCVSFYSKIYLNFLEGLNKISLVRRVEIFTSLGSIISMVLILLWKPTLLNLVIVNQIWVILVAIRDYVLCRKVEGKIFDEVNIKQPIDKNMLGKVWTPAWRSGVGGIMSVGVTSITSVIYAQFGNSGAVASYLLAIRIISQIREVSMAPFYSKLPLLAIYRVQDEMEAFMAVVKKGMFISHLVFFVGFLVTTFFIDHLLVLIHSEVQFVTMELWILIGVAYFLHRYGAMHLQVYLSTNHVIQHIADGIAGGLFIVSCWLLSFVMGIYSIPVAMIISYGGFYCWYSVHYSYKSMGIKSFWQFEKTVGLPFIIGFVLIAIIGCLNFFCKIF